MELDQDYYAEWNGNGITATVLYSRAGLGTQIWIEGKQSAVLVDCGDGCLRDIVDRSLDFKKLAGIVITHGHFDHMGSLHSLLAFLRMIGRKEPLPILAPAGCIEVFSTVSNFCRIYEDTTPFEIPCRGLEDNNAHTLGEFTVLARAVRHCGSIAGGGILDPIPACGYRITAGDETVAISGDTGTEAPLEEIFRDADLAIIEATHASAAASSKETLERVHLTAQVAQQYGELAKEYILIHRAKRMTKG